MFDTLLFTSVHSNLEHRFVILTESFSPLVSELHNPLRRHPNEKCALTYATPFYTPHSQLAWSGLSRFALLTTNHNRHWQMLKREYNADGNSHYVTHYLLRLMTWPLLFVRYRCSCTQNDRLDVLIPNLALVSLYIELYARNGRLTTWHFQYLLPEYNRIILPDFSKI